MVHTTPHKMVMICSLCAKNEPLKHTVAIPGRHSPLEQVLADHLHSLE